YTRKFMYVILFFFVQAEDGIRDFHVTGVQTCALPISLDPGARDDLTQGRRCSPFSMALRASSPAAIITLGLEVLVQEVMAAMTTEPLRSTWDWPPRVTLASLTLPPTAVPPPPSLSSRATSPAGFSCIASSSSKAAGTPGRGTRSWGRRGPARLGSTSPRSRCRVSENSGSWPGSRHSPWALLYASTRATTSAGRPVRRR